MYNCRKSANKSDYKTFVRKCPLCGYNSEKRFDGIILNKYNISYYQCKRCALLFTEKPYWLTEAYSAAIANTDTGVMVRNINNAVIVSTMIKKWYSTEDIFVDKGGGYGFFVRLMRDKGFSFYWSDKYAKPLVCDGYEWDGTKAKMMVNFEVFEHFEEPGAELDSIFHNADDLVFSTTLYGKNYDIPDKTWWYYQFNTGQHIVFYSERTLRYIAKIYKRHFYKIAGVFWLSKKKCSRFKILLFNLFYYLKVYNFIWIRNLGYKYAINDMETQEKKLNLR